MHVEQFQLRGVELAARPGASFENPQQRCVGAMAGRQQQQVAGLQGAQLAGVQRQAGPLQRQAQRSPLSNGGLGAGGRCAGRACSKAICCARSGGRGAGVSDDTSGAVSTAFSLSMARSRGG
ncbi:hypothetical protein Z046_17775 [Pseudomonas aeruginosa VRFPA09]|nr:hypothetical protein Z046_17775 [Pseudomonas aeruginosa VRFPA09]